MSSFFVYEWWYEIATQVYNFFMVGFYFFFSLHLNNTNVYHEFYNPFAQSYYSVDFSFLFKYNENTIKIIEGLGLDLDLTFFEFFLSNALFVIFILIIVKFVKELISLF